MASKFLSLVSLLALAGTSLAGVTTYAYNPYAAYHHLPAAVTTYASPAHQVVYHHAAPAAAVYHHSPVLTKSYVAPAPVVAHAAPVVKTVAAAAPVVPVAAAAPVVAKTVVAPIVKQVEVESEPRYDFSYGVHDSLTGDIKSQVESRNGGNVAGSYSVIDADGYKRTVTYTADDLNGFNAVVQREPLVKSAIVAAAPAVVQPAVQQVVSAHPVVPVQQQQYLQYLPQQQQQVVQQVEQQQQQQQQPQEQPIAEPVPVEYPEQQQPAELEQQQPQEPQYPQDQHFPPYPQAEGDDSDVVDVRSANNDAEPSSTTAAAPVTEAAKEA